MNFSKEESENVLFALVFIAIVGILVALAFHMRNHMGYLDELWAAVRYREIKKIRRVLSYITLCIPYLGFCYLLFAPY
jgi:hypothetical protein